MLSFSRRLGDGGEARTWIVAVVKEDKFFRKDGAVERSGTRKHPLTFDIWWMYRARKRENCNA